MNADQAITRAVAQLERAEQAIDAEGAQAAVAVSDGHNGADQTHQGDAVTAQTTADVLYQSVVQLGPRPPEDVRVIHRAVEARTHPARTLWARPTRRTLVIRTPVAGVDWTRLPSAQAATTVAVPVRRRPGQRVRWALIGNPTRSTHTGCSPDGAPVGRGVRRGVHDPRMARDWLLRRLAGALEVTDVTGRRLPAARGAGGLVLTRWMWAGHGAVRDPDALAVLLTQGVGRGKAFGCGLLVLAEEVSR